MNCSGGRALSVGDWICDGQWLSDDPQCSCTKYSDTSAQTHQCTSSKYTVYQFMADDKHSTASNSGALVQLNAGISEGRYHIAAALGHNSVVLCCWWSQSILQRVCSSEFCILYLY